MKEPDKTISADLVTIAVASKTANRSAWTIERLAKLGKIRTFRKDLQRGNNGFNI